MHSARHHFAGFLICSLFALYCSASVAEKSRLELPSNINDGVELFGPEGLNPDSAKEWLQVFVGGSSLCCENRVPVAGRYSVVDRLVSFMPVFGFVEGQVYTVLVRDSLADRTHSDKTDGEAQPVHLMEQFVIGNSAAETVPAVISIFPSGEYLPENVLRFYIEFSAPMQPHVSGKYIKLLDADGSHDSGAFMSFKQELWSEDRRTLTLLVDPGRIKRGVVRNLDRGPALIAGNRYSLVVEQGWSGVNGNVTTTLFEKHFTAIKPLRTRPNTGLWKTIAPVRKTREPLSVEFDRPFDRYLAKKAITVVDADGQVVAGSVSIGKDERSWHFSPHTNWSDLTIQLLVDTYLEDVAGNNMREMLDRSIGDLTNQSSYQSIAVTPGSHPG